MGNFPVNLTRDSQLDSELGDVADFDIHSIDFSRFPMDSSRDTLTHESHKILPMDSSQDTVTAESTISCETFGDSRDISNSYSKSSCECSSLTAEKDTVTYLRADSEKTVVGSNSPENHFSQTVSVPGTSCNILCASSPKSFQRPVSTSVCMDGSATRSTNCDTKPEPSQGSSPSYSQSQQCNNSNGAKNLCSTTLSHTESIKNAKPGTECRLSDSSVEEEPAKIDVRHVGSEATLLLPQNIGAGFSTETELTSQEEFAQDSGIFVQNSLDFQSSEEKVLNSRQLPDESTSKSDPNAVSEKSIEYSDICVSSKSYSRTSSMFDEYFPDGNVTPTDIPKLNIGKSQGVSNLNLTGTREIVTGSEFDEIMNEPLPDIDVGNRSSEKSSPAEDGRLSIQDEYFNEEELQYISLPPKMDQVTHAIKLMQQSSREDLIEPGVEMKLSSESIGKKKRPDTLPLKSSSVLSTSRQNSLTPGQSKR